jgi:rare lipoprotein A
VDTGKSVQVTINDRGPYAKKRVIDLSKAAADQLGITRDGTTTVTIEANPPAKIASAK